MQFSFLCNEYVFVVYELENIIFEGEPLINIPAIMERTIALK